MNDTSELTDEQCDEFRRTNGSFNDMVRTIYAAGRASMAKVPEGWKLVPLEITREMHIAGHDAQATFQERVAPWLLECFGEVIAADTQERNHRFLEESLELVQACGATASEAYQLVEYVYGRPVGEKSQEAGGVMVTLAALCRAQGIDMHKCGEIELARISEPSIVEKIRAKQAAKPKHSPLPQGDDTEASGKTHYADDDTIKYIAKLEAENAALRKLLAIAELKNASSLANNLCPDCRDKQKGKPCLACTVQTLERRLAGYEDAPVVAWKIVGVCGNPSADRSGFFFNAEKDDRIERWSKLGLTVTSEALIVKPAKEGTKI